MAAQTLSNKWVNLLINGLIALVIGSIFVFVPESIYTTIIIILGVILLLSGIGFVFYANKKGAVPSSQGRIVWTIQGLFNIGIGVFMMMKPVLLYNFIMTFVGIWLIVAGAIQLFDSHQLRNVMNHYRVLMVWGFINIALGLVVILWPEFPIKVFGYIAYLIALILFIYSGVFYSMRNKSPYGNIEDADILDIDETDDVL
jgi:uncharacterized membrane protein HdeD (DUF308 family)